MDFGKAFSFTFEDKDWIVKILLGSLIMLIPIVGQFVLMGYGIAIIRNVKAGNPRPLPDWSNFADFLLDGVKFWVANLVYALPILILVCPLILVSMLPVFAIDDEDLMAILGGISGLVSMVLVCPMVLYGILLSLVTPVLQIHFAESGEIESCFRFREIFRFTLDNIGNLLISLLIVWGISVVVVPIVGTLTLGLLVLPATVWLAILSSHLYGQIGRQREPVADDFVADDPFAVEAL